MVNFGIVEYVNDIIKRFKKRAERVIGKIDEELGENKGLIKKQINEKFKKIDEVSIRKDIEKEKAVCCILGKYLLVCNNDIGNPYNSQSGEGCYETVEIVKEEGKFVTVFDALVGTLPAEKYGLISRLCEDDLEVVKLNSDESKGMKIWESKFGNGKS